MALATRILAAPFIRALQPILLFHSLLPWIEEVLKQENTLFSCKQPKIAHVPSFQLSSPATGLVLAAFDRSHAVTRYLIH